jgi:hypothetical protein
MKRNFWVGKLALKFIVRASRYSLSLSFRPYCKFFVSFQTAASNILHLWASWKCLKNIILEGLGVSLALPQNIFLFTFKYFCKLFQGTNAFEK